MFAVFRCVSVVLYSHRQTYNHDKFSYLNIQNYFKIKNFIHIALIYIKTKHFIKFTKWKTSIFHVMPLDICEILFPWMFFTLTWIWYLPSNNKSLNHFDWSFISMWYIINQEIFKIISLSCKFINLTRCEKIKPFLNI